MNSFLMVPILMVSFAASHLAAQVQMHPLQTPTEARDIYPADADAHAELHDALASAQRDHQRVLVVFGANWCFDCLVLDKAFRSPEISPLVEKSYKIVHVDIGRGEKNNDLAKKYDVPLGRGIPAIAVLDAEGKLLYSQKHGEFEAARRMNREDVIAFLEKWKP